MPPSYQRGGSVPEEAALTGAVVELYKVRVEPRCKLIQWKVYKLFGSTYSVLQIRDGAHETPGLLLDPDVKSAKRAFSVLLEEPPEGFQGFHDGKLDLPDKEIEDFKEALLQGGWPLSIAPDHQAFEIAFWLCNRHERPEHFPQALGFVRSSVTTHLLGTKNGRLVAFVESEEYLRRCNMERKMPTGVEEGEWYVATQASLRGCLRLLLRDQWGRLHVSEIKKLIRDYFGAELSETAFGFGSLSQLLTAEFMQKDFVLEKVGEGKGDTFLRFRRGSAHWGRSDPWCRIDRLQAGMKKLRDVPTVPTAPSGTLMSVLASQPLKETAPALASAASTAASSPAYVKPPFPQLGDALQPRLLDFSKAEAAEGAEVKEAIEVEISEPCKIEAISMVRSGQRSSGQTKETVSMKRGKKGKRGEETQPDIASVVPPEQHTAIPELQEDPRKSDTSGVADVQTVSKNRRAKTNKKGGEETQPSTASSTASAADAGQHYSCPKLQEDAKESNTSGVVDAHGASKNFRAKTNKKGVEDTQPSTASVADAGQHPSCPKLKEDPKESSASGAVDVQTVSTSCGSAEVGKKELKETSPSAPDFAPQYLERTQRGETVPIQAVLRGSWNAEPVGLDEEENLEPGSRLLPAFTLPSWCSIQRTFIQCAVEGRKERLARPQSTPARSEQPDSPLEPPTSCVMEDV